MRQHGRRQACQLQQPDALNDSDRFVDEALALFRLLEQPVRDGLQERLPGVLVPLIKPGIELHHDVRTGSGARRHGLLQVDLGQFDQRRFPRTPTARDADGQRSAVSLANEVCRSTRDHAKVKQVDFGLDVMPHVILPT